MTSFALPTRRRRTAVVSDRPVRPLLPVPAEPLPAPGVPADVRLEPGNLVAVCDALGAQMFSVVDGEVTFTARSAGDEQQWRGRLGAAGLVPLRA